VRIAYCVFVSSRREHRGILATKAPSHEEKLDADYADCADFAEKYSHELTRFFFRQDNRIFLPQRAQRTQSFSHEKAQKSQRKFN